MVTVADHDDIAEHLQKLQQFVTDAMAILAILAPIVPPAPAPALTEPADEPADDADAYDKWAQMRMRSWYQAHMSDLNQDDPDSLATAARLASRAADIAPREVYRLRRIADALVELGAPDYSTLADPGGRVIAWVQEMAERARSKKDTAGRDQVGDLLGAAAALLVERNDLQAKLDAANAAIKSLTERRGRMAHQTRPAQAAHPEPNDGIDTLVDLGHAADSSTLPYLIRITDGWIWSDQPTTDATTGGLPWDVAHSMAAGQLIRRPTYIDWTTRYEEHYQASRAHGNNVEGSNTYAVERTSRELGPEPSVPEPEIVVDLLGMVGVSERLDTVAAWTPEQLTTAFVWAGAVHLDASDNEGVHIPPRPGFFTEDQPTPENRPEPEIDD